MASPNLRRSRSRRAAFLGAILTLAVLASPSSATDDPTDHKDRWMLMDGALRILWTGDARMKRMFADSASSFFRPLFIADPDHDEEDVRAVIGSLQSLIRTERDDWISTTLLKDLSIRHEDSLDPLFLDALKEFSPNLRWCGINWFTDQVSKDSLPELEHLWRIEERPWVKGDLMAALAHQGSGEHLEDFLSIARGKDPGMAEAAIRALGKLKDDRAIPTLAGLAARGARQVRLAAVDTLTSWPDSAEALEAILAASQTRDPQVQRHAAAALGSFDALEAASRLLDLIRPGTNRSLRIAAAEALKTADPGVAIPALVEVLHEPIVEGDILLHRRAIEALMELDDPSVLDTLSDLDTSAEEFPSFEYEHLVESLKRDRNTEAKTVFYSTDCSSPTIITDPDDPRMRIVAPPPGLVSIRCWEFPGGAGDPASRPRIKAGTPENISDHFEFQGESWVKVRSSRGLYCWVPLRFIESPATAATSEEVDKEETMVIRREFDLPASEVESDVAQGLMDAGLLEVIEPGDEVIGVAITIDPEDFDRVLLLARSCGLNETMLDGEIYEIVADLAPLYRGHPALDRFRRAPRVQGSETDEVIDLDIEELTDQ